MRKVVAGKFSFDTPTKRAPMNTHARTHASKITHTHTNYASNRFTKNPRTDELHQSAQHAQALPLVQPVLVLQVEDVGLGERPPEGTEVPDAVDVHVYGVGCWVLVV